MKEKEKKVERTPFYYGLQKYKKETAQQNKTPMQVVTHSLIRFRYMRYVHPLSLYITPPPSSLLSLSF